MSICRSSILLVLGHFLVLFFRSGSGATSSPALVVTNERVLRSIDASGSIVRISTKINATFSAPFVDTCTTSVKNEVKVRELGANEVGSCTKNLDENVFQYDIVFTSLQASKLVYIAVKPDDPNFIFTLSAPIATPKGVQYTTYIDMKNKTLISRSTGKNPINYLIFSVNTTFANILDPFPSYVGQLEDQKVIFYENHYFYSPYFTQKQKTVVKLASDVIIDYTKKHPCRIANGNTIIYGPYADINPFERSHLSIHYVNNKPFQTFVLMHREVDLSHWGRARIEDIYDLKHFGARLKGLFSRMDYSLLVSGAFANRLSNISSRSSSSNSSSSSSSSSSKMRSNFNNNSFRHFFQTLKGSFPDGSFDEYYKDQVRDGDIVMDNKNESSDTDIGTLYTTSMPSNANANSNAISKPLFSIDTRFPLFGGWNTQFFLGFYLPIGKLISFSASNPDLYEFRMSINTFVNDIWVQSLVFNLILPLGAVLLENSARIEAANHSTDTAFCNRVTSITSTNYSYMFPAYSYGPRQVVVLTALDLVQEHKACDLVVMYSYPHIHVMHMPSMIAALFFLFFFVLSILNRI